MKRRVILKIIIFIVLILIILFISLLISKNSGFINNIGHIKIEKIEEKEITKIDVTDLEDNGSIRHEHFFKTLYDENKHWQECTICGKRNDENNHSYVDNGWLYGNSCKEDPRVG